MGVGSRGSLGICDGVPARPPVVCISVGQAGASARAAWLDARHTSLGCSSAAVRGSSACVLAAEHRGRIGPDTPYSLLTSANPVFITPTVIYLHPAG